MKGPSVRKIGICALGGIVVTAILVFAGRVMTTFGQDALILTIYSKGQMDSLRAALGDGVCAGLLEERLAYSTLWHIGSTDRGLGFKHVFYFGGKRRHTARLEGLAVVTVPDGQGGYQVSVVEEEFAHRDPGGDPAIRDAHGLEVLKAALADEGVRREILDSIDLYKLGYQRIGVETLDPDSRYRFTIRATLTDQETVVRRWSASRANESSPYLFLPEED